MKARPTCKKITHNAAAKYCRAVAKRVNVSEEAHNNQRKKTRTGLIKISSLINNIANHSDPRLAWKMFHKIDHMHRDITKQETEQVSLLIQGLSVNFDSTKAAWTSPATPDVYIPLQPTMPIETKTVTTIPEDLEDIQTQPPQVWNCDKIGFDPNGSWRKVVYNYKFFTGDRMWRTQTGERAPLWYTALISTRADGQ